MNESYQISSDAKGICFTCLYKNLWQAQSFSRFLADIDVWAFRCTRSLLTCWILSWIWKIETDDTVTTVILLPRREICMSFFWLSNIYSNPLHIIWTAQLYHATKCWKSLTRPSCQMRLLFLSTYFLTCQFLYMSLLLWLFSSLQPKKGIDKNLLWQVIAVHYILEAKDKEAPIFCAMPMNLLLA